MLLRCLIDKVVVHRPTPETVQARIVWRGGETTTLSIPVPVGAFADLAGTKEMEQIILLRSAQGATDEVIAHELTEQGYRSPMQSFVLPITVKILRLKHGQFLVRSQSHPRHVVEALTLTQLAKMLDIAPHWIYDRIDNGTIQSRKMSKRICFCFLMTPPPSTASSSFWQGPSRRSVFEGSIKMRDRSVASAMEPFSSILKRTRSWICYQTVRERASRSGSRLTQKWS